MHVPGVHVGRYLMPMHAVHGNAEDQKAYQLLAIAAYFIIFYSYTLL